MIAHLLKTSPGPISAVLLVVGFAMMASGYLPLSVAGAALILLAFFVPFIRLSLVSNGHQGRNGGARQSSTLSDNPDPSSDASLQHPNDASRAVGPKERSPARQRNVSDDI
jgi:hypothetical protein